MNKKMISFCFLVILIVVTTSNIVADTKFDNCVNNAIKKEKTTKIKLKKLNCANLKITSLSNLKDFKSLEVLNVENNKIKSLPNNLYSLTKLKTLNLSNNSLASISSKFAFLDNLTYLNLSGNTIYYLPKEINKLTKLIKLDLSSTHLLRVPSINNLTKLKTLYLSNNQIFIIPSFSKNPIVDLEINNNFLKNKNIKSAKKTFKVTNQKKLKLNNDTIILVNNSLYTPKELLQRVIVSDNDIPLYGITNYSLRDIKNEKGKSVKVADYFDMNSGQVYKNYKLITYVNFDLNGKTYNTNAKISIILKNSTISKGDNNVSSNIITNDGRDNLSNKEDDNKMNSNKTIFDNMKEKNFSTLDSLEFFSIDNLLLLSMWLLLLTIIPFSVIVIVISRVKKAKDDIEIMYTNRK